MNIHRAKGKRLIFNQAILSRDDRSFRDQLLVSGTQYDKTSTDEYLDDQSFFFIFKKSQRRKPRRLKRMVVSDPRNGSTGDLYAWNFR